MVILIGGCTVPETPGPSLPDAGIQPTSQFDYNELDGALLESIGEFIPPIIEWPPWQESLYGNNGYTILSRTIPLSSLANFSRHKTRLINALERAGIRQFEIVCYPSSGGNTWELTIGSMDEQVRRVELVQEIKGKVAIIIDDCGNSMRNISRLNKLDYPLTLAVLPGLVYTSRIDHLASEKGFEVLLHCPLEATNPDLFPGPGTIYRDTPVDELIRTFEDNIKDLPHIRGVNNHMGSAFTADTEAMRYLLTEIKRNDLFFIDSLTIKDTVTVPLAQELGIPFDRRDIFIDHENTEEYIIQQLDALKRKAHEKGSAIAIGHDRPLTITILIRLLPSWAEDKIQIVPVSDLVRR